MIIFSILNLAILLFMGVWLFDLLRTRVPYIPTYEDVVEEIIGLVPVKPGSLVIDLGCGDGRIVRAYNQKYQAKGRGYEIKILTFLWAKFLSRKNKDVEILRQDFFKSDLSRADLIFCYLYPEIMEKLSPKFQKELKPEARIVSYCFQIPGWIPEQTFDLKKPHKPGKKLYIYRVLPKK